MARKHNSLSYYALGHKIWSQDHKQRKRFEDRGRRRRMNEWKGKLRSEEI